MSRPITVTQPYLPPLEEFQPYLEQIWQNKWLTNAGPFHQQLEVPQLDLATGSLPAASGTVPIAGRGEAITVSWEKDAAGLRYTLETPVPLTLHLPEKFGGGIAPVDRTFTATWPLAPCR